MATNKVQTALRLDEICFYKVKALARLDHRSFNNFIEHVMEKYIEEYEDENGPIEIDYDE